MSDNDRLEIQIENLKKKLLEKENLLKAKKDREQQRILNQIKPEFFRLKVLINQVNQEEKKLLEPFEQFLVEHKFNTIRNILFRSRNDRD